MFDVELAIETLRHEGAVFSGPARETPSYRALVGQGRSVEQPVLKSLVKNPCWQLLFVLGDVVPNPPKIREEALGRIYMVLDSWHLWGIKQGYLP